MADFRRLPIRAFPRPSTHDDGEARRWREYELVLSKREIAGVSHVEFSPLHPYNYAVSSSTRVQIYNAITNGVHKTISKFKDVAYSGSFRQDGRLLVAGGEQPIVQVFNIDDKSILRQFRGHTRAVHVARFAPDNTHVMSCSDDATMRCWDVPAQQEVAVVHGHTDYIRTGAIGEGGGSPLWVTGSYDHTVKLWDPLRSQECVLSMDHGHPVEAVLVFPSGGIIASAGGSVVRLWDVLAGGRLLQTFSNHQKTITALCLDRAGSRLLSGGADQMVKVYDTTSFAVVHTLKFSAPILSLALSPDGFTLAAGMVDGTLAVRRRPPRQAAPAAQAAAAAQRPIRPGTFRFFQRGGQAAAPADAYRVERRRRARLRPFDKALKQFRYGDALDAALETRQAVVIATVLEELERRGGLATALASRDETGLGPLLEYLLRNLVSPRFSRLMLHVANGVLRLYGRVVGESRGVEEMVRRMRTKLRQEAALQAQLLGLQGALETLIALSPAAPPPEAAALPAAARVAHDAAAVIAEDSEGEEEAEGAPRASAASLAAGRFGSDAGDSDSGSGSDGDDEDEEEEEEERALAGPSGTGPGRPAATGALTSDDDGGDGSGAEEAEEAAEAGGEADDGPPPPPRPRQGRPRGPQRPAARPHALTNGHAARASASESESGGEEEAAPRRPRKGAAAPTKAGKPAKAAQEAAPAKSKGAARLAAAPAPHAGKAPAASKGRSKPRR
eukprot:tig00020927_g15952.t1